MDKETLDKANKLSSKIRELQRLIEKGTDIGLSIHTGHSYESIFNNNCFDEEKLKETVDMLTKAEMARQLKKSEEEFLNLQSSK